MQYLLEETGDVPVSASIIQASQRLPTIQVQRCGGDSSQAFVYQLIQPQYLLGQLEVLSAPEILHRMDMNKHCLFIASHKRNIQFIDSITNSPFEYMFNTNESYQRSLGCELCGCECECGCR